VNEHPTLLAEVRASLPPIAQAYIAFVESPVAPLGEEVATLQAAVAKLQGQMVNLQTHAHQVSGNSSRPPSSDPPGPRPRLKHKPSGRKRVGQRGHLGHARIQLAADQMT
jgi:transposase